MGQLLDLFKAAPPSEQRPIPPGDYHPIPVEFFLENADLTTCGLKRRLPISANTPILGHILCYRERTSTGDIQSLLNEARDSGHTPKEAVLSLNAVSGRDPAEVWMRRYFELLDDEEPRKALRSRRDDDHRVGKPTVYARVVQYQDSEIKKEPMSVSYRFLGLIPVTIDQHHDLWPFAHSGLIRRRRDRWFRPFPEAAPHEIAIQYWFLYFYNDFSNVHEGDWESITLFLDENRQPLRAAYASHEEGRRRRWVDMEVHGESWDDVKLPGEESESDKNELTHPAVYVAAGSHASYFEFLGHGARYPADVSFAFRILQFAVNCGFGARQAYDLVPDPLHFRPLGPGDLALVYIPTFEARKDATDWAWLNHPRLYWGSKVPLDGFGTGGPAGPATEPTEERPNWKWYNPWLWAYDTCVPDDLAFWPFYPSTSEHKARASFLFRDPPPTSPWLDDPREDNEFTTDFAIRCLRHEDMQVRTAAANMLGSIGPAVVQAMPVLIEALGDDSKYVREAAAKALEAATDQHLGQDAAAWREWWDEQQQ